MICHFRKLIDSRSNYCNRHINQSLSKILIFVDTQKLRFFFCFVGNHHSSVLYNVFCIPALKTPAQMANIDYFSAISQRYPFSSQYKHMYSIRICARHTFSPHSMCRFMLFIYIYTYISHTRKYIHHHHQQQRSASSMLFLPAMPLYVGFAKQ